jgi:hypothetical protein
MRKLTKDDKTEIDTFVMKWKEGPWYGHEDNMASLIGCAHEVLDLIAKGGSEKWARFLDKDKKPTTEVPLLRYIYDKIRRIGYPKVIYPVNERSKMLNKKFNPHATVTCDFRPITGDPKSLTEHDGLSEKQIDSPGLSPIKKVEEQQSSPSCSSSSSSNSNEDDGPKPRPEPKPQPQPPVGRAKRT